MTFTAPVAVTRYHLSNLVPRTLYNAKPSIRAAVVRTLWPLVLVQPGDEAKELDYYVDRSSLSAVDSFLYNDGTIRLDSDTPVVAEVCPNPPAGILKGNRDVEVTAVATYLDLAIKKRGNDYKIVYESSPVGANRTIYTSQILFVSFSTNLSSQLMKV